MSVDAGMAGAAPSQASGRLAAMLANEKTIFVVVIGVILAMLVLPPLFFLVMARSPSRIRPASPISRSSEFRTLAGQRGILLSAWNSLVFAILSAIFALLIGGVVAWIVERTNAPLQASSPTSRRSSRSARPSFFTRRRG